MLSIKTKIDASGFWYQVNSSSPSKFSFSYFIIGSMGKYSSGEIQDNSIEASEWKFIKTPFSVIHLGITGLKCSEKQNEYLDNTHFVKPEVSGEEKKVNELSRRKMIKSAAATLLFGLVGLNVSASNLNLTESQTRRTDYTASNNFDYYPS